MSHRIKPLAVAVATAIALSSCASLNVNALPQPGNSYRNGYDIVMAFESVLNLPDRAKVVLDQRTVGTVTKVTLTSHEVDVTARIESAVVVPSNVHAVLQQATVLGDIYVSLDRSHADEPAAPVLRPGGHIPLAHTTSPSQLEDTIAHLANFVSSGSIQRIQNAMIGINRITPSGDGAVRRLASRFTQDVSGLSDNIDVVDRLLASMSETGYVLNKHLPEYRRFVSSEGMLGFDRATQVLAYAGTLVPSVGSIYSGGFWLVPFLNSAADAAGSFQRSKGAVDDEIRELPRLLTNYFLPQDKYPAINITSIVGPDGRELSGNVQDVLRILGAMP
jgi:phospholipid/cholesterol/gamma-HCH transport system substrate-binding protein